MGKSNLYLKSDVQRIIPGRKPPSKPTSNLSSFQNPKPIFWFPFETDLSSHPAPILGLPSFAPYLAEDNMLALSLMHQLSIRHSLSTPDVAINLIGPMSFADYFWRRVRWIRVRKEMTKIATLVEPLTESVVLGWLVYWAVSRTIVPWFRTGWFSLAAFWMIHWGAWATVDGFVMTSLSPSPEADRKEWAPLLAAWMARECLAFPVWAVAMWGSEVEWRGRTYRVLPDGKAKEIQHSERQAWWNGWLPGTRSTGARDRAGYQGVGQEELS